MADFVLKLKTKSDQIIVKSLLSTDSIHKLKKEIFNLTNIPEIAINVKFGYPPKELDLKEENRTLASCEIKSGDILIVEEKQPPKENDSLILNETCRKHTAEKILEYPGLLMRKVVPADNSCLFTSIGFVIGGKIDVTCGTYMRQIIAEAVSNDEDNYSEAILGKPNKEYCEWILKSDSWGGAIELSVLCTVYGIEIAVIDTINAIINRFGEDKSYDHRVFLIFDGIHYDPLYLESKDPGGDIQTIFPSSDDSMMRQAEQLALEAQSSRQFTDVNKFTLQCNICRVMLKGQKEAVNHAMETGHESFGEVS